MGIAVADSDGGASNPWHYLGAAGTDVALETADVALMVDDLSNLSVAVVLSPRILAHHSPEFVRLLGAGGIADPLHAVRLGRPWC